MMIGAEKGQSVIALMDNSEIKAVVAEIRNLNAVSPKIQESIRAELRELGYDDEMKPAEVLTIIRFLFDGRKIRVQSGR